MSLRRRGMFMSALQHFPSRCMPYRDAGLMLKRLHSATDHPCMSAAAPVWGRSNGDQVRTDVIHLRLRDGETLMWRRCWLKPRIRATDRSMHPSRTPQPRVRRV
ncbi:hypothetical protein M8818_000982 [Zalaria obscura]|uniref:Uncharacterized protein n=1 Tax=Zalaria obscura TaxID=2024903 RepID=A0ACC3SLA2_9PEZI